MIHRAVNLLVATCFFIAELYHLTQGPGIVETDFMRLLAEVQMCQHTVIAYGIFASLGVLGAGAGRAKTVSVWHLLAGGDNWRILDIAQPVFPVLYRCPAGSHHPHTPLSRHRHPPNQPFYRATRCWRSALLLRYERLCLIVAPLHALILGVDWYVSELFAVKGAEGSGG